MDCVHPVDAFLLNDGYSVLWLVVVYLFGAYIRKYEVCEKITSLKCMIGFFAMIAITFISKIAIWLLTKSVPGLAPYEDTFVSYTSVTILLSAIF